MGTPKSNRLGPKSSKQISYADLKRRQAKKKLTTKATKRTTIRRRK